MSTNRPTGIIRTLPYFGAHTASDEAMNRAYERMMSAFACMESGEDASVSIALAQKPTIEVLHCYILIQGHVIVRANISHFEPGKGHALKSWDGRLLCPKWWAVLTAPISYPPEPIRMRGFQGFRYTEDLW